MELLSEYKRPFHLELSVAKTQDPWKVMWLLDGKFQCDRTAQGEMGGQWPNKHRYNQVLSDNQTKALYGLHTKGQNYETFN